MKKLASLLLSGALLLTQPLADAATYYIATTGSNANSCAASQSIATPKLTFASAWGCLSAGDTLIVRDGTYNVDPSPPAAKAGTAGNVITVQAENDGAAKITQSMDVVGCSYLTFIGLKFTGVSYAIAVYSNGAGAVSHHNTFQRIGWNCSDTTLNNNGCFDISDGSHHNLIEDSWGWRGGRYTILVYGGPGGSPPNTTADYNTFRRVVLRMGPATSTSGNPQAAISLYYASHNLVENVMSLDSNPNSNSSNSAFYITSHVQPPKVDANAYYGIVALNTTGSGAAAFYLDVDNGGNSSNTTVRDSVFWDNTDGITFYNSIPGNSTGTIVSHIISGANTNDGYSNWTNAVSVRDSIFTSNGGYGVLNGSGGQGSTTENYNDIYNNTSGARSNISAGANSITSNPGLLYICRTEAGSPVDGTGQSGTDMGADITYRYQDGVKGTTLLWPWPYESRIFQEMCTDAGVSTGFCASTSITDYVWGYLGNATPTWGTSSLTIERARITGKAAIQGRVTIQ